MSILRILIYIVVNVGCGFFLNYYSVLFSANLQLPFELSLFPGTPTAETAKCASPFLGDGTHPRKKVMGMDGPRIRWLNWSDAVAFFGTTASHIDSLVGDGRQSGPHVPA